MKKIKKPVRVSTRGANRMSIVDFTKSLVFFMLVFVLGLCAIKGRDLVLKAPSPIVGYILIFGIVVVVGSELFIMLRDR